MHRLASTLLGLVVAATSATPTALASTPRPSAAASPSSPADARWLDPDAVADDLALAREAYARIHPGYDRYTSRATLDAAWDAVVAEAREHGGMTVATLYLRVQAVLAQIRCAHTKAELGAAMAAQREASPVYLPLRWQLIEGRAFVLDADPPSGLQARDEILAIDGHPVTALVERYTPWISVDGHTDHAREVELAFSTEFRGGAIEHFMIAEGRVGPTATLEVRRPDGAVASVRVDRVPFDRWRALIARTYPFRLDFADAVHFERIGERAAVLSVDTFVNYRHPVRPDTIYDPIFAAVQREGRDTLILDLRRNGGGSSDAMQRLLAHLVDEPARVVREVRVATLDLEGLREHLSTWDRRVLRPRRRWFQALDDGTYRLRRRGWAGTRRVRPDRRAFDGRLIVLTSRANGSGVTNLLAKLQDMGRATLVGEPTGGSAEGVTANILVFLTLPRSGIVTRIPTQRLFNDVASFTPGRGIDPDVVAPMTVEAYLAGEDPAMDAALALSRGEGG